MSYRLSLDLHADEAVRDVARERADHALQALHETAPEDPATAVHDVRKDAKKLRALLRLVQPATDPRWRRGENRAIADSARALSGTRDADVLAGLAADLRDRAAGQAPEAAFTAVHDALAGAASDGDGGPDLDRAIADFEALAGRVDAWPLDGVRPRTLIDGLERSYRRGRAELRAVRRHPGDAERLHEWRKRVKDLWYQQRLLRDAWPDVLKAQANELDELGEALGDDHDLSVLRHQLTAPEGVGTGIALDLDPILAAIDHRRAELQRRALAIGARVYAEKPDAFARRHRAYLNAARGEAGVPAAA